MDLTTQQLADFLGGELKGRADLVLKTVASLKNAGSMDLSYAEEKFEAEAGSCDGVLDADDDGDAVEAGAAGVEDDLHAGLGGGFAGCLGDFVHDLLRKFYGTALGVDG